MHDSQQNQPYVMLGAGELVSSLWKEGEPHGGWRYRFNLFRMSSATGQVTQLFDPEQVTDFVKLARLLAFTLADDGCLEPRVREDLASLASRLDDVLGDPESGPNSETLP